MGKGSSSGGGRVPTPAAGLAAKAAPLPGVVWLSSDGTIVNACQQATLLLRTTRGAAIGQQLSEVVSEAGFRVPTQLGAWPGDRLGAEPIELRLTTPSGDRSLRLSLHRRSWKQLYVIVESVAAIAHLERLLAHSRARLEDLQALMLREVTAAPLAHDLNSLLAAIAGETTLGLRRASVAAARESFRKIDELVAQAARVARGMMPPRRASSERWIGAELELNAALRGMEPVLQSCLDECCELRLALAERSLRVALTLDVLERIVLNLVVNARDALVGSGTITVRTEPSENGAAILTVSDTGAGMSERVAKRAFEPLFTTKDEGTGFGLTVVQRLVLEAGGTISLESVEGEGTMIEIRLPLG